MSIYPFKKITEKILSINLTKKNQKFNSIFGVGLHKEFEIKKFLGLNNRINSNIIKKESQFKLLKEKMESIIVEKELKEKVRANFLFAFSNKTFRSLRNKLNLPCRGQRTHTNAKTKKNSSKKKK